MHLLFALLLAAASPDENLPLETVAQQGHSRDPRSLAYSADGRYLVSADEERALVWEVRSGRLLRTIRHGGFVGGDHVAALTADGARLTVAGGVYDVRTGKQLFKLEGATLTSRDGLTAAGPGGIYDTGTGQRVKPWPAIRGCGKDPKLMDLTPDRKLLAVQCSEEDGGWTFQVRVFDADTGQKVAEPFEGRKVYNGWDAATFSPNGKYLAAIGHDPGGGDNSIFSLTELATNKVTVSFSSGHVYGLAFRPATSQIAFFGEGFGQDVYYVALYDLQKPRDPLWRLSSPHLVFAGAFQPDGELFAFGSGDKLVHRARAGNAERLAPLAGAIDEVQSMAFRADGTLAVAGRESNWESRGAVRTWDLSAARQVEAVEGRALALGAGGTLAVSRGHAREVELDVGLPITTRVVELPAGKEILSRTFTPDKYLRGQGGATLSAGGTYLFLDDRSGDKGAFTVLEAKTGKEIFALPRREFYYQVLGVDPAEKTALVLAPLEGKQEYEHRWEYLLLDLPGARVIRRYTKEEFGGALGAWPTPDGAFWAVEWSAGAGIDNYLIVLDGRTGETRQLRNKGVLGIHVHHVRGHTIFFGTPQNRQTGVGRVLHAMDLDTLRESWSRKLPYDAEDVVGSGDHLVVTEQRNVKGNDQGRVYLLDARTGAGKPLFETESGSTVTFSADGTLAAIRAWFSGSRADTLVYDLVTGRQVADLHEPSARDAAAFSPDNRQLATVDENGNVAVHALPSGKLQATLLALRDREWAISLPDGSYAASRGATRSVQFVRGMKIYTFENFDLRFNRPDRVLQALGRASPEAIASTERAWQKRVVRMGFVPSQLGQDLHLPEVEIPGEFVVSEVLAGSAGEAAGVKKGDLLVSVDGKSFATVPELIAGFAAKRTYQLALRRDGAKVELAAEKSGDRLGIAFRRAPVLPPETQERKVSFRLHASDSSVALDRLNLYVNDVPVFGARGQAVKGSEAEAQLEAPLLPGRNVIQLSATNEKGAESLRETFEVECKAPPAESRTVLVAIGVSQYADARMNLTYAAKDAQDLAALLSARGPSVEVVPLLDAAATREGVLAAREKLMATKPEDEVIVFYAGHGLLDDKLDYFLATPGVDFESPAGKGLPYEALEGLVDGIPALRRLVLVDACHSGEVDKDEAVLTASAGASGEVKSRGFNTVKRRHVGQKSAADLATELFADLRRGSGAMVIASASGTEVAFESAEWKNGVFTYALLEGLKSGKVRVSELRDYVTGRVRELTHGQQTPTSRRENLEFDFKVW